MAASTEVPCSPEFVKALLLGSFSYNIYYGCNFFPLTCFNLGKNVTFFYFKYTKTDIFCEIIFSRLLFVLTSEEWERDASPIFLHFFPLKSVYSLCFGFVWYTDAHNKMEIIGSIQALSYYCSNYKWIENFFANIKDRTSHISKKWVRADSSGSLDSLWCISILN